jgi:hypothetical protein
MRRLFVLIVVLCTALASGSLAQREKPNETQKEPPAQASVAVKKSFATISAKDPAVAKATDAKDLAAVKKLVNKEASLKGTVVKVFTARGNSIVILNFAKNYKEAASVVLKPEHYAKFPNMETLKDKTVLVTGKVILFREQPEIELTKPEQVKVVQ